MADADYKTVAAHLMGVTSRRPTVGKVSNISIKYRYNVQYIYRYIYLFI